MTKLWKHDGKWRFMATVGKMRRAVLEVPFDADQDEAQAIADAEVEAQAAIEANYHPWEVKADAKPAPKPMLEEWEQAMSSISREFGKPEVMPPSPGGVGWRIVGGETVALPNATPPTVTHFWYWQRPKP